MKSRNRKLAIAALLALIPASRAVAGTVTTDGSVGRATSLTGPNFAVTSDLGKQVGPNLFHSLGTFNLSRGETATFSGPGSVANVITRVTGGPSSIDGRIQCTIPSAHFYLINPSGVLFGPDATLDVKGSFVVSTADYLKFADGSHFSGSQISDTTLTSAAPAAFGFLAATPAPVVINGSSLSVTQGQTLTVVSGGVQILNGTIVAPAGRVNLVSMGGTGELTFDPTSLMASIDVSGGPTLGDVSLSSTNIGVGGTGLTGGRVSMRGANIEMVNSDIFANNAGASDGLGVDIIATANFSLTPGAIITDSSAAGRAGPVNITAANVTLDGTGLPPLNSGLSAAATSTGKGGDIQIHGGSVSVVAGSIIFAGSFGAGDAGTITLTATGDVHIDGPCTIATGAFSTGKSGDISISAGSLEVTGGSVVSASTRAGGNAGNVSVAAGSVTVDNTGSNILSIGITADSLATGAAGNAGQVSINANSLSVTNGAVISASSVGPGAAGSVTITGGAFSLDGGTSSTFTGLFATSFNPTGGAAVTISVTGTSLTALNGAGLFASSDSSSSAATAGTITVLAKNVTLLAGGEISADASSGANSGNVTVAATDSLTLDGQGFSGFTGISVAAMGSTGNAGNMQVSGGAITLAGGAGISADNTDGPGGSISIRGGDFSIAGGAAVSASSFGAGNAGTLTMNVRNFTGQSTGPKTMIDAGAAGTGAGGTINITAGAMTLKGPVQIGAETAGTSPAGIVNITATSLTLDGTGSGTSIDAATLGMGDAGTVNIQAGTLQVINGATINASTLGSGRGGIVNVTADNITLDPGTSTNTTGILSISTATDQNGPINNPGAAGTVNIHAGSLLVANNAVIDTTTFGAGAAGGINVNANSITLKDGGSITSNTQGPGAGAGGAIAVQAGSLQILNGSQITTDTLNTATGGSVTVNVTGALTIDGQNFNSPSATGITATSGGFGGNAGKVAVRAGNITLDNRGTISSDSEGGIGSAGSVTVTADSILVQSRAKISSGTFEQGNGGDVTVTARDITLDARDITVDAQGASVLTGISVQTNGSGNAGSVHVAADSMQLIHGGEISSSTFATGAGGSIYITATDLTLAGKDIIDSASAMTGAAGTVAIHVNHVLRMSARSDISSEAPFVSGGGVSIFAGRAMIIRDSNITTKAADTGGTITLVCPGAIDLLNSTILTKAGGNGGNMIVDPSFVVLENSRLSANGGNNGGNISVQPDFLLTSQSHITASGARGVSGMLQITPDYNLTGALLSLPASLSDNLTLEPQCAADLAGNISSFIVTGRGAEPLTPGGYVPSMDLRLPGGK